MTDWLRTWLTVLCIVVTSTPVWMVPTEVRAYQETTTIFLVRHAEQTDGDNPSLSTRGRDRALTLVHVLEDVELNAIHSTPLNRTLETARPVAERHGLEVITTNPTPTFAEDMAKTLREAHIGETVLVVSHSNTVPAIINALGGGPYEQLPHDEFDSLFLVTLRGSETEVIRMQYGQRTP